MQKRAKSGQLRAPIPAAAAPRGELCYSACPRPGPARPPQLLTPPRSASTRLGPARRRSLKPRAALNRRSLPFSPAQRTTGGAPRYPPGRAKPPQFPEPRSAAPYLQRMEAARCLGSRLTPQPPRKFPDVSADGRWTPPAAGWLHVGTLLPGSPCLRPAGRWEGGKEGRRRKARRRGRRCRGVQRTAADAPAAAPAGRLAVL